MSSFYGITATEEGKGKENTETWLTKTTNTTAAKACSEYSYGGYSDWFLPSKDELNWMYINLAARNIGGSWHNTDQDDDTRYASSSEYDGTYSWSQDFKTGKQSNSDAYKYNPINVRPVRMF